jgi:hypothetical protein
MAGTTGLEPATSAVTGQRSNHLSYVPKTSPVASSLYRNAPRESPGDHEKTKQLHFKKYSRICANQPVAGGASGNDTSHEAARLAQLEVSPDPEVLTPAGTGHRLGIPAIRSLFQRNERAAQLPQSPRSKQEEPSGQPSFGAPQESRMTRSNGTSTSTPRPFSFLSRLSITAIANSPISEQFW